jgi:hypothetical protein
MRKILAIIKSNFVFIILSFLLVLILFFIFKNKNQEQKTELPPLEKEEINQKEINSIVNTSILERDFEIFPEKANVYKTKESTISQTKASSFAEELGFNQAPFISQDVEFGLIYTWTVLEKNLNIYPQKGYFLYTVDLLNFPDLNIGNLNPINDVEQSADDFVFSKIVKDSQTLKPTKKESFYIKKSGPLFLEATQEQAEFIQVNYDFKIETLRIVKEDPKKHALSLIIGPQNRIFKIEYFSPPEDISIIESYPLKSKKEVLEEITTRPKISLLEIEEKPMTIPSDLENILAISYQKIELVYLQNPKNNYLYPLFLITGEAKLKTGENAKTYLYLSAIKEEFLKN